MHARVLRYLDEVVRCGSIRKAAEVLHVAPTAVNRQILDLEAELGAPLFERIGKRLRLTPLGEMVLAHVRQTLREHAALLGRVEELKGARRGEVALATTSGLAASLMPALVGAFRARHPGIVVRLLDLPVEAIAAAVVAGEVDLGLGYDLPAHASLRVLAGSDWGIGAVMAPGHPLAGAQALRLADCLGHPLILPAPALSIRAILDEALAHEGLVAVAAVESTSTALIQRLAATGAGVAWLNPLDVVEARRRGELAYVPLRDAHLRRQALTLVARRQGGAAVAVKLFAQALEAELAARSAELG